MRSELSILHVDLDAFFAAVEQRDKPSLRGKPVIVGGIGSRGVVATASYEARAYGVRSAMPMSEARRRCPHAAFLAGRFSAYREASATVMSLLRELSELVQPLSLDEAFVDLATSATPPATGEDARRIAVGIKTAIAQATGGLTASVGIASSKLLAKIASDLDKPDGIFVVPPGTERDLLHPMLVTVIPGVGPATSERLRRAGVKTVSDLAAMSPEELIRLLGQAHGSALHALSHAIDDRPVVAERETKSISVEDTYDVDLVDRVLLNGLLDRQVRKVATRLSKARLSGRTVTVKLRLYDFETHTRSATLPAPTDDPRAIGRLARALLADMDVGGGVRLLGVGVSGLADWIQDDLFGEEQDPEPETPEPDLSRFGRQRHWVPGIDVVHSEYGQGWVWGSGLGRVTVRFETRDSGPGPVRTLPESDPGLRRLDQLEPGGPVEPE
ncbi:MAG: DNA polymerase IV [Nocardioidaceae bacterium]|nr:MAG: DNA polymerase IV [Nocardioidaceae bacterium]